MRIGIAGVGRIGAFHASTLASVPDVDHVVLTDALPGLAARLAEANGYDFAPDLDALLSRVDALVIATPTSGHTPILRSALAAKVPTLCEKPVATTLDETIEMKKLVDDSGVSVQVGFQRRFDSGYRRAQAAVAAGELGFLHTVRMNTLDQSPPLAAYLSTSGGLFRDCGIHDFDVLRFVTGHEVATVFAVGANKGADFFTEIGDIDTGAAVLTMDDGTLVTASATRYNGGGHDVRMEVMGSKGTIGVGYDDSLALRSVEADVDYPHGPQKWSFMERFLPAYRTELAAFCELVAGRADCLCTVGDALEAFRVAEACELSRLAGGPVDLSDVGGAA
jgi:myo-inositol 2-dehydrogenase/D-chiro-inositol 1-dehydrogenase